MAFATTKKPFLILATLSLVAAIALVGFVIYSLRSTTEDGFPPLHLGQDKCAVCGMIVSDKRFAVRAKSMSSNEVEHFYAFDDLGCFLKKVDHESDLKWGGFVYDFDTQKQIRLKEASFEHGAFETPMGSGWIARKNKTENTVSFDQIRDGIDKYLREDTAAPHEVDALH